MKECRWNAAGVKPCIEFRTKQQQCQTKDKEKEDEEEENAGHNAALNIGLSIAWKYFNQPPFDDKEEEDSNDEIDSIDRELERVL